MLTPRARKFALIVHVACSVGSLGAVAAFLALAVAGLKSPDAGMVHAAYPMMELVAWLVVLPMLLSSLLTGLVQALGTPWGLFRHYWVLAKLLLSVFATVVLLLQMSGLNHLAMAAAGASFGSEIDELRRSPVLHAVGGLMVLLVLLALSAYKPRGLTRYGWRRQHIEQAPRTP
jgi:hypothetical protein